MEAVLDAATKLFAERGPGAVTVRDVAASAGVNHALVHRYYGTKMNLLQAVLARHALGFAALTAPPLDVPSAIPVLFRELQRRSGYVYTLARALMDGMQPEQLRGDSPTLRSLLAQMQATGTPPGALPAASIDPLPEAHLERDPRVILAALSALALGWQLFGEYLVGAAELAGVPRSDVDAAIERLLQRMVVPADSSS
jgi:TetR/AcrR family transcriptional regulator, repressor for neighboring sulfatase